MEGQKCYFPLYRWMDDLQFYVHFNSVSVNLGLYGDHKRLCAMEPGLYLEKIQPSEGIKPGTTSRLGITH